LEEEEEEEELVVLLEEERWSDLMRSGVRGRRSETSRLLCSRAGSRQRGTSSTYRQLICSTTPAACLSLQIPRQTDTPSGAPA